MKKIPSFGTHLMLDFYGCDSKILDDMSFCYNILAKLPAILDMHSLTPPIVVEAPSNEHRGGKDPGGYSGFVIIAESHISLHTFAKKGFVSIDVYSCKDFDTDETIKYFENAFRPKEKEVNIINRGTYYQSEKPFGDKK